MKSEKIVFANLLRGIGALAVLISHYVGIFWVMHPAVATLMEAPVIKDFPVLEPPLAWIASLCIFFGQFGVGVFFIVSGLVIPFSLNGYSKMDFLANRVVRIYPVYIVGFTTVIISLWLLSQYTGSPFSITWYDILAHYGVITRAPMNVPRLDGISWTLEVEIYFYIAMCLFGNKILNLRLLGYLLLVASFATTAAVTYKYKNYLVGVQVSAALLLLLGIAYHSYLIHKLSGYELIIVQVSIIFSISVLWFFIAPKADYIYQWVTGYFVAVMIFTAGFYFRSFIHANKVLTHFSDISYPLYAVHVLLGYTIMYVMISCSWGVYASIFVASLAAYLFALVIHFLIERPAMRWIKNYKTKHALST